jgi:hypothetical protein
MPWINLTIRRGTFTKDVQHAVMAKLTDALMFWEKIPDNPEARKKMMGWVYEVAEDSGYSGGRLISSIGTLWTLHGSLVLTRR